MQRDAMIGGYIPIFPATSSWDNTVANDGPNPYGPAEPRRCLHGALLKRFDTADSKAPVENIGDVFYHKNACLRLELCTQDTGT